MLTNKVIENQLEIDGYPLTAKYVNAIGAEARKLSIKYGKTQDYEDIFNISLIEATRLEGRFDVSKGNTFFTFVRKPIRFAVQKVYGYSKGVVRKFNKINKFMKAYEIANGHLPDIPTIAKGLEITPFAVRSIFQGKPFSVSIDSINPILLTTEQEDKTMVRVLEALTEEEGNLIRLKYIEGWSSHDLCQYYRTHPTIIEERVTRILQRLRDEL